MVCQLGLRQIPADARAIVELKRGGEIRLFGRQFKALLVARRPPAGGVLIVVRDLLHRAVRFVQEVADGNVRGEVVVLLREDHLDGRLADLHRAGDEVRVVDVCPAHVRLARNRGLPRDDQPVSERQAVDAVHGEVHVRAVRQHETQRLVRFQIERGLAFGELLELLAPVGAGDGVDAEELALGPGRDLEMDVLDPVAGLVLESDHHLRLPHGVENVGGRGGHVDADRLVAGEFRDEVDAVAPRVPSEQEVAFIVGERRAVVGELHRTVVHRLLEPDALVEAAHVQGLDAVRVGSARAVLRLQDRRVAHACRKAGVFVGVKDQIHHGRDVRVVAEDGADVDDLVLVGVRGADDVQVARRADVGERVVVVERVDDLPAGPDPLFRVVVVRRLQKRRLAFVQISVEIKRLRIVNDGNVCGVVRIRRLVLKRVQAGTPPDRPERDVLGDGLAEVVRIGIEGAVLVHLEPAHEGVGVELVGILRRRVRRLFLFLRVIGPAVRGRVFRFRIVEMVIVGSVRRIGIVVTPHIVLADRLAVLQPEPRRVARLKFAAVRVDADLVPLRLPLRVDDLVGRRHRAVEVEGNGERRVLVPALELVVVGVATLPVGNVRVLQIVFREWRLVENSALCRDLIVAVIEGQRVLVAIKIDTQSYILRRGHCSIIAI